MGGGKTERDRVVAPGVAVVVVVVAFAPVVVVVLVMEVLLMVVHPGDAFISIMRVA